MPINRQKLLTLLTLGAIALLVLDKIVTPPLTKLWNKNATQIANLKTQVQQAETRKRSKESLRRTWAEIQASSLTNDTTMAEGQLMSGLTRWSTMSDVRLDSIVPQWKQGSDASFKTLEYHVDASGSIERLGQFLYDLETDPMALKVQTVELTSKDNNGSVIALGLQISGLVLTGQEPKK